MEKKIFGSICFVIAVIIVVTSSTSFAYYTSSANSSNIQGNNFTFDVDLGITTVYKATQLVPLQDSNVTKAITKSSNKCRDSKGYDVCSLYTLNLTNNGEAVLMNGYVTTSSTTYTTDHLKYQIFDSSFNPITDATTISRTSSSPVYFKKGSNMVATELSSSKLSYYLVIWLTETNSLQNEDYSKTFTGKIGFETINGGQISANFSA